MLFANLGQGNLLFFGKYSGENLQNAHTESIDTRCQDYKGVISSYNFTTTLDVLDYHVCYTFKEE
jgi:hypothetical protein